MINIFQSKFLALYAVVLIILGSSNVFAAPPANDSFANAETVSGMQVHLARTNIEATKEPGEPEHGNNTGGSSVWFKWTAPMTRVMTFTTNRSLTNLDTMIHIYQGTSVNTLTSMTFGQDITQSNLKSYVSFNARQGETYYIAIDGKKIGAEPPATGFFVLDIQPRFIYQGADFDKDGMTDLSVFRPVNGTWYIDGTTRSDTRHWGMNGDIPLITEFGNNDPLDYTVYRPTDNVLYRQIYSGSTGAFTWGSAGDIPVAADFFETGISHFGVFRPSNGIWYFYVSPNDIRYYYFGINGDIPVVGHYSPDWAADIAVFRPSNGTWYFNIRQSANQSNDTFRAVHFGQQGDKPVPADYDGDGLLDIAIYRPSTGTWWVLQSSNNQATAFKWGLADDIPTTGDFDGDGKFDYAVFRPSQGTWYIRRSSNGSLLAKQFGQSGDIPMTASRTF